MSTRCHVIVISSKEKHYVYHHCDGYLDGVGAELKEFISSKYAPEDYSSDEFCRQLENWDSSYEYEDSGIHGDEEYLYTISIRKPDVNISVKEENASYDKTSKSWNVSWTSIPEFTETFTFECDKDQVCEGYEVIGWPDIQNLMGKKGFKDNSALITPNESMGIGCTTYLVSKKWLNS